MTRNGIIIVALLISQSVSAAETTLEEAVVVAAPKILKYCRDKEYQNIAVFKFQVDVDGKGYKDNAGTISYSLCDRIELALLLQNKSTQPIGIINNANAVAEKVRGANHLVANGRTPLFAAKYPLYWGKAKVSPDVILSGFLKVGDSPDQLILHLCAVADGGKVDNFLKLTFRNQPEKLAEMGQSYVMRGLFDEPAPDAAPAAPTKPNLKLEKSILYDAASIQKQDVIHPLSKPNECPVGLEVFYDGKTVPIEIRGGKAFIPEPNEHQKVHFSIKHVGKGGRFGAVLKVNGLSTIDKDLRPDVACRVWIMDKTDPAIAIRGFQLDNAKAEEFRVSSLAESARNEVRYGRDVGTITLTVFREGAGLPQPPPPPPEYRGEIPAGPAYEHVVNVVTSIKKPEPIKAETSTFENLQNDMLGSLKGLIEDGGKSIQSKVQSVPFVRDPIPVETLTIVYYKSKSSP